MLHIWYSCAVCVMSILDKWKKLVWECVTIKEERVFVDLQFYDVCCPSSRCQTHFNALCLHIKLVTVKRNLLLLHIKRSKLRWIGHVVRMPSKCLPGKVFWRFPVDGLRTDPGVAGEILFSWCGNILLSGEKGLRISGEVVLPVSQSHVRNEGRREGWMDVGWMDHWRDIPSVDSTRDVSLYVNQLSVTKKINKSRVV